MNHDQQGFRFGLAGVADGVVAIDRVARGGARPDPPLLVAGFQIHHALQHGQVLGRAGVVRGRGQHAVGRQRELVPFELAGKFHRPEDAQHVAGVIAGQRRQFVRFEQPDRFRRARFRRQQFADASLPYSRNFGIDIMLDRMDKAFRQAIAETSGK